ncbi:DUF4377 domain-containing protein [Lysobacter niastensis]|uniref:DUF4377 domain-containing protein n=1 Tax=Lysobacter niastensis TaxID=380629 RepID=A0ABS0B993_9GAMM|nr:DUF4377 domain-containing protein [Lysobacter niastensis]MBF6024828.1 DUF4377 domain-containing protein [Lysobacter niastensis]
MKKRCAWVVAAIGLTSCSQILLDDATVVRTIHVASVKAACPHDPTRECYQISDGAGAWQTVDAQIAGFNYAPGTEYVIEVSEPSVSPQTSTEPPRWELMRVIDEKPSR